MSCTGFPADLLSRKYEAVIEPASGILPNDRDFVVRLTGPTLFNSSFFQSGFAFGVWWGNSWDSSSTDSAGRRELYSGFRYLTMMGDAPTSEPAISTEISLTIPFSGDFVSCHLKSDRGGANDCNQVPAELIINTYRCWSPRTPWCLRSAEAVPRARKHEITKIRSGFRGFVLRVFASSQLPLSATRP